MIDFDSTIAESMESLFANQHHWNGGQELAYTPTHWSAITEHDYVEPMWDYFHSAEGISHIQPKDGAIEAINRLTKAGYWVAVITDRSDDSYVPLRAWFSDHGLWGNDLVGPMFDIIITNTQHTKQMVVDQFINGFDETGPLYDVVAIVDDAPHHMEAYTDMDGDFRIYSFRYPYNEMQIEKGLAEEITSWAEFEKLVLTDE